MPFERNTDYIQVDERIQKFLDKWPEGRLQSELIDYHVDGRGKVGNTDVLVGWVLIKAYAYRTPDDPLPGIGYSSLVMPGGTPYTRNSELENCETSAWGRAIAATGIEVRRGIASAEEVANKESDEKGYEAYSVNITSSDAEAPAKGGHQKSASRPQITQIIELGKGFDLDAPILAKVVSKILEWPDIDLPGDEEEQKRAVKKMLVSLTADEAGLVIQSLSKSVDESVDDDSDLPDVPETLGLTDDVAETVDNDG